MVLRLDKGFIHCLICREAAPLYTYRKLLNCLDIYDLTFGGIHDPCYAQGVTFGGIHDPCYAQGVTSVLVIDKQNKKQNVSALLFSFSININTNNTVLISFVHVKLMLKLYFK